MTSNKGTKVPKYKISDSHKKKFTKYGTITYPKMELLKEILEVLKEIRDEIKK